MVKITNMSVTRNGITEKRESITVLCPCCEGEKTIIETAYVSGEEINCICPACDGIGYRIAWRLIK